MSKMNRALFLGALVATTVAPLLARPAAAQPTPSIRYFVEVAQRPGSSTKMWAEIIPNSGTGGRVQRVSPYWVGNLLIQGRTDRGERDEPLAIGLNGQGAATGTVLSNGRPVIGPVPVTLPATIWQRVAPNVHRDNVASRINQGRIQVELRLPIGTRPSPRW